MSANDTRCSGGDDGDDDGAAALPGLSERASREQRIMGPLLVVTVLLGLVGLPLAVWLDLRQLSGRLLQQQATEIGRIIDDMRNFYGSDVVGRVLEADGPVTLSHHYQSIEGAIPIPATLSIELGQRISARDGTVKYRFVSDLPFRGRAPHPLDAFEQGALATLRREPDRPVVEVAGSIFDRSIRVATPVIMAGVCVGCHNTHPDSPKRDWQVGDVRGVQEISVVQPIRANIFAFRYLLIYFVLAAATGLAFILMQRRQAAFVRGINRELMRTNEFLAAISAKLAKYLSPQIYKDIFSGRKDARIATERKKLTIFFSDIENFTATTERLQPEDLTGLLNEYLTEMSAIALDHGATVDKFIGDAIMGFFGDPETKGVAEDARACVRMAIAMQRRLTELEVTWRQRGLEQPFRARIGITTGYCNVGNFGSEDRMDYTIIGAQANLAARLQTIAEPGGIVLGFETYALVRDLVRAHPLPAIMMKGIAREVVPYAVEGLLGELPQRPQVFSEHGKGLELFVDLDVLDRGSTERARVLLEQVLAAINLRSGKG